MQNEQNYSVYVHTNKENGKRYVGITRQRPERRWQNGAGYARTYFGNAIAKYGWDGFLHEVVASGISKEDACALEIKLIHDYRSNTREYGYNISKGGETMDVISPRFGIEHPNHQRVKMIDATTGEVLKVFNSQTEAANVLGIGRRGINKACIGIEAATYKGYRWEYADKKYDRPPNPGCGNYKHDKIQKPIVVVEPDGTERHFESLKSASATLGVNRCTISLYVNGVKPDRSGRRWCFDETFR